MCHRLYPYLLTSDLVFPRKPPFIIRSAVSLVKSKQYGAIMAHDQMVKEMGKGRVFVGFYEGRVDFAPTYRRVPSPCPCNLCLALGSSTRAFPSHYRQ